MNNINEIGDTHKGQYALGRVAGRAAGRKDYRKKGEFSRKDVRNLKWTEGLANTYHDGRIGGFADGFNDAYMKEYGERCGEPYEKWNESKEVNRKLIRLTESDLRKIVKQSVNKILKESSWADGADMNESIEYHGPTPFSIGDVAYHNQQLRGEIKDIIEFCDIAKNIPREYKHANFYTQLINNLRDLDTHAWWDLDNADDI